MNTISVSENPFKSNDNVSRIESIINDIFEEAHISNSPVTAEMITSKLCSCNTYVPPVEIGGTIYKLHFANKYESFWISEHIVAGFHIGEFPKLRGTMRPQYIVIYNEVVNALSHIPLDHLNKYAFMNRDDAKIAGQEIVENAKKKKLEKKSKV